MTEFLIVAVLFTLIIMVVMVWPLLCKSSVQTEASVAEYDAAVYKSQLEEVKREEIRGDLTAEEAEAARVEIARRILQSDADNQEAARKKDISKSLRIIMATSFIGIVAAASIVTYLNLGNPGMPSFPYAEREGEREAARLAEQNPGMDTAIANAKRQAEENPDLLDAWLDLALLQMQAGKPNEAVFSYAEAVRVDRYAPGVLAAYGEAQALAANGNIDEQLKALFEEAASLDADDPRPVFYLAQFEYQKGDPRKALNILIDLIKNAPEQAGWTAAVHLETMRMAEAAGIDISDQLAELNTEAPFANAPAGVDVSGMSAEERDDMITGMVDGLAEKLADNPDDLEGWQRLARAATVLQREEQVIEAYDNLLRLEGESITLLLEKANALMEVNGGRPTADVLQAMGSILQIDPENAEALWFSGMASLSIGEKEKAELLFNRALNSVGKDAPEYEALKAQIELLLAE
ncbi:c-type cytochrome biogenesis protein CcmI [Curvivirga sp.]|uniref:c-type cytochrome biogenesis protein CcmI n=1 Tax=Curvivirga sp. TaxID=2856848 RepID=UPI003B59DE25